MQLCAIRSKQRENQVLPHVPILTSLELIREGILKCTDLSYLNQHWTQKHSLGSPREGFDSWFK